MRPLGPLPLTGNLAGGGGDDLRIVFVLPTDTATPKTGAGQRSRLFYDACRQIAPTVVVGFNGAGCTDWFAAQFPGARGVVLVTDVGSAAPRRSRLGQRLQAARRLLAPARGYAADPGFRDMLLSLGDDARHTIYVFRYLSGFCLSGLTHAPDEGRRVVVDVDDRDDQKYASQLEAALGKALTRTVLQPTILKALGRTLRQRLSQASLVCFTADEDAWALDSARVATVPNVAPTPLHGTGDALPPSACSDLLFVGTFAHPPNRRGVAWFLSDVWPAIAAACPQARVRIVGLGDWKALDDGRDARVDLVGTVEDVGREYARARLAICPIAEGGGSKIKLLEAASYGRPAVATPHSARGFPPDFAAALTIGAGARDFAARCIALLLDGAAADRAGAELRAALPSREGARARICAEIRALAEPWCSKQRDGDGGTSAEWRRDD